MSFKYGIIGLPNVGKSTLFRALTKSRVEAKNFPFCTIKPNISIVPVPDSRIEKLSKIVRSQSMKPTVIEFVDVAGLMPGASKGIGLGNQFLSNIRDTAAIGHVVRCFEDDNITHVRGKIDPVEDINIINTELALFDIAVCERAIYHIKNNAKNGDKQAKLELCILERCLSHLNNINMLRTLDLSNDEISMIRHLGFLTLKKMMYIANINENRSNNNPYLDKVRAIAKAEKAIVIEISAKMEADIAELDENERNEIAIELGFNKSSLNRIINTSYNLLNLRTYFTVGVKEVRAWTIPIGTTALQASGKIHSDFRRGFIRAQVISFFDFVHCGSEQAAREAGKIRFEGKKYMIEDGDVIKFLFNI